ncbi:uncharacterized protein DNG_02546 [Cephalotrichum gorgonifer]|uniref:DUF2306 domain-containing protein n=1 Tax=Cephalotrichum gorgonifer TaxID=2041049 RepID=A0AAE8SSR8_9PEZI|nr:uncharacterized protein DNG_02546 [Cephalotrichum gorgonifer]
MVKPNRPPANAFVAAARKVYNPIGFSKGYNFVLFFIFAGALMGFTLARLQYLDYYGIFCGDPGIGECYFSTRGLMEKGLIMHLAAVLPASFLVVFQFVPAIRHKYILVHRVNGYVVLLLSVVSTVGGIMSARNAFGGALEVQLAVGFIGILFVGCLALGYVNIKRLQLEQHRAWMLRGWFYAASIITLRFIQITMATIISSIGGYWAVRQCAQVNYTLGEERTRAEYGCEDFFSGKDPLQHVLVEANMSGGSAMTAGAALGLSFGPAIWLAFSLHAIGIEVYLRLTPVEHERLRNVSYQRQVEAGMRNPGMAGLTADRLGDSIPWKPSYDSAEEQSAIKLAPRESGRGEQPDNGRG